MDKQTAFTIARNVRTASVADLKLAAKKADVLSRTLMAEYAEHLPVEVQQTLSQDRSTKVRAAIAYNTTEESIAETLNGDADRGVSENAFAQLMNLRRKAHQAAA